MTRSSAVQIARNILQAVVIILPLVFASIWVTARAQGGEPDGWARGVLYYLLTLGPLIVLGAVLHHVVLALLSRLGSLKRWLRWLAIALCPIFPLAFLATGSSPAVVLSAAILLPLLVGGALYGATMKLSQ